MKFLKIHKPAMSFPLFMGTRPAIYGLTSLALTWMWQPCSISWMRTGRITLKLKLINVHGDDVVERLGRESNNMGFILSHMDKADLFKTVILDGALPRKTFSMGEAADKHFYLECRSLTRR